MRTFQSAKTRATVQFILATIFLAVSAFFYVKFYYAFRGASGTILERLQANLTPALLFGGLSLVWIFNWFAAFIKYTRVAKYYRPYFGAFLGRLLLLVELVGWGLAIAFLFI